MTKPYYTVLYPWNSLTLAKYLHATSKIKMIRFKEISFPYATKADSVAATAAAVVPMIKNVNVAFT